MTGEHHHTEDSFLIIVQPSSFFMSKWGAGDGTQDLKRASKHSTTELHPKEVSFILSLQRKLLMTSAF
jgi:hypothetical protein